MLHRTAFFYAYYGLVALMHLLWLQGVFDTLTGLFDRVGIWKNARKKVGMLCHPCRVVGTYLDAAYKRRMAGEGLTYRSHQRIWVQCPDCGADLEAGCLVVN